MGTVSGLLIFTPWLLVILAVTAPSVIISYEAVSNGKISYPMAIFLAIGFLLAQPFAFAFARFWLRCWPVNANGIRRYGVLIALLVILACVLGFLAVLLVSNRPDLFSMMITLAAVPVLVASVVVLMVHLNPRYYMLNRFVLYLRRFSTISDRATLAQVLRAAPRSLPLLFIASPGIRPRNWDSFMWAFAGLRLWRPVRSLPIQVRSRDADWESYIEEMVQHASAVIMDLSNFSESLETEVRFLVQHVRPDHIIWLREANDKNPIDWKGLGLKEPLGIIRYQYSYTAALSGLIWKLALVGVNMIFILTLLGVDAENPEGVLWTDVKMELAVAANLLIVLFVVFYTRPALTKTSVRAIREAIKGALRISTFDAWVR
jgi:hypothetical protein